MKLTEPPVRLVSHRSAQSTRNADGAQPRAEWPSVRAAATLALAVAMVASALSAQSVKGPRQIGPITYPTSDASDRIRLSQLAGDTSHLGAYLMRSPSIVLFGDSVLTPRAGMHRWLAPDFHTTVNSAIPLSLNEGGMWAGRGVSLRLTAGAELSTGRLRVVIAPEFWATTNARFDQISRKNGYYYFLPSVPMSRNGGGFANRWYAAPYSADVPWRFSSSPMGRVLPGQTGIWYNSGPVEFGVTTENMWWGPGIRNAIIMSDNAAGIPRLEMRTPHPIKTRIGDVEAQWFVGALAESKFFDTTSTNNVRSISAAVLTWQPVFQPTLTLGVTRAVYATSNGIGPVAFRWFDVFAATGQPANHVPSDSSLTPGGRDQLFSLFGRWLFPDDGFEVYTEWARQELPTSIKDFIIDPTHSHGYTLGLQYRRPGPADKPTFRVQGEVTTLEQSGDFKNRPVGVFYTSRRVLQGYTQQGMPIGASFGPGGSSQWLALDRVWPSGSVGLTFNRIRWNEGVRSAFTWPAYLGDCNHDVSIMPGVRAAHDVGRGYLSGGVTFGNRLNYNFQNISGCKGAAIVDVHNTSVSISFSPFK